MPSLEGQRTRNNMVVRAFLIWLILVVLAVVNGVSRNALIIPRIGEHGGHVISTVMFCVVIFLVSWLSIRLMGARNLQDAKIIGMMWAVLTVMFEFLAGHYLFGNSWDKLIADYNVMRGRIWILVLFSSYFAPLWAAKVRGL